jgi:dihydropteroate synthase
MPTLTFFCLHFFLRTLAAAVQGRTQVMGILNVTPDSFSDGGQLTSVHAAVLHAQKLVSEGADMLDIGGQSTRPGAGRIRAFEEAQRILPVIRCCA